MNWKALKFALPIVMYLSALVSFNSTGPLAWLTVGITWMLIPLLELFLKPGTANLNAAEEEIAKKDPIYDWLLYLIVPLQFGFLAYFLSIVTSPLPNPADLAARILTMGIFCGSFGINVGHELGHRNKPFEQALAKSLLLTSLYTHFFIEHNKGHHKNVATPLDPSSAPYGMWLYRFHLQSIAGVYRNAWHIANGEMKKKGLPVFHWKNEMLQLQVLHLLFIGLIAWIFGLFALLCFFGAAGIGILLLETVNYVEHYGLTRRATANGQYERALPQHSWNSNHMVGRLILFELTRHSDHHYLASRKYQVLRHHDEAPQLPTGYPGSMLLAFIPPLYLWIMDKQMAKYGLLPAAAETRS